MPNSFELLWAKMMKEQKAPFLVKRSLEHLKTKHFVPVDNENIVYAGGFVRYATVNRSDGSISYDSYGSEYDFGDCRAFNGLVFVNNDDYVFVVDEQYMRKYKKALATNHFCNVNMKNTITKK